MPKLSSKSRRLWAKKSRSGDLLWLSLPVHLEDAAEMAFRLWRRWVPEGVKRRIQRGISGTEEDAEKLFLFLAASHDIGKATTAFSCQECGYRELDERIFEQMLDAGLPIERYGQLPNRGKTPHALASQVLLHKAGCPIGVAVILGAHHGKPPDREMLRYNYEAYPENYYNHSEQEWQAVWQELIDYALTRAGYRTMAELPEPDATAQVLLSGLLIFADWIASDSNLFPYVRLDDPVMPDSRQRADEAWGELSLTLPWEAGNRWESEDLYHIRFDIPTPHPVQETITEILLDIRSPGIFVIEAPMGEGKTEAALVAAEILADQTKRRGVFFALPTQATSDGIFPRMLNWVSRLDAEDQQSLRLMHGKAQLNGTFQHLASGHNINIDEDSSVYVHEWFTGRKRAILDDFVVGTIDQLLMAALKQKHVMLRHLGLANKIVIIDECHAFDAYMNCYLERALNWLGAYGVPVIVLSATLPAERRKAVIEAYRNKRIQAEGQRSVSEPLKRGTTNIEAEQASRPEWTSSRAYPLITYTDGSDVKQAFVPSGASHKQVKLTYLQDDEIVAKLEKLLCDGGCAGVIVNSVDRAQKLARLIRQKFGDDAVHLLHARFLAPDRIKKEETLIGELGKPDAGRIRPKLRIVVGTQVLEQSLDIDFDVLITDLCPTDLLLQRIGRLHRHLRERPRHLQIACCLITGAGEGEDDFDSASAAIYGKYLLMRSKSRLPECLRLPDDIPELVQDVYDFKLPLAPDSDAYRKAEAEHQLELEKKRRKADTYRMSAPKDMEDLINWLNTDVSDKNGEASVRDTEDTFEVVLIRRTTSGQFRFLPWIENGMEIDPHREPHADIAQKLARCTVRLPVAVGGRYDRLDETIKLLERMNSGLLGAWQQSPWLRGELFLVLDEHLSADLGKYRLTYHQDYGLEYTKRGEGTDRDE